MIIPDDEYDKIYSACSVVQIQRPRCPYVILHNKDRQGYKFFITKSNRLCCRKLGEDLKIYVNKLSAIANPEVMERNQLRQELKQMYPDYNEARINFEVDYIYEMRKSVQRLTSELMCKPEDALKALQIGLAQEELKTINDQKELKETQD